MAWTNRRAQELRERAEQVIPGGMYGHESTVLMPAEFPQFFSRGKGARLWDADENEYVDFLCAWGPNLLGYGFEPVEAAAAAQQARGDTLTGPSEIMIDLAEAFTGMVSHADWAMFCKNGTDATSMAMVTARAHTGRKTILVARGAYHGAAPWCTPRTAGILAEDRAHVVHYDYNDADSLADAFKAHEGDVAGVFATPFRHEVLADQHDALLEYALAARALCDQTGALLIVDEVRAGFRLARGSSWSALGVQPDLSTWGKCFANGYPISALLGSNVAREAAKQIFVTGSFWFSATPMAAAIETLRQIRETDYLERLVGAGRRFREGLQQQAASHGFGVRQTGPVQMPLILFDDDPDFRIGYGWVSECLKRGVYLSPYHNMFLSSAHSEADIAQTLAATDEAFEALKKRRGSLQPHPALSALMAGH
ncbi:MAG: aminotransferase class III-fold pyridoxal phosphate-dependent enzyme [Phenylobacterium sp.]|uniref:aminotransferase class III-fold pyridoxal phosphate-dependent enzyme n=1 Tax=Phenylobacterium sp. TaxID=1871053 RepID=UPI00120765F4|nr:aminotransferase class III-fold pyridoxal phosphate-dependent enzyme [Phenylobacterium sp.]TAJ71837.1 MAG: aminotransferase class III-fold pyridoxal phosphate-dependent enzyme [Phenylobacterium sp.]